MNPAQTEDLSERSEIHWVNRYAFPIVVYLLLLNQGAIAFAVYHGQWWIAAALVVTASHLAHGALIGFHEASHGLLRRQRWLNEFDGMLIGTLGCVSFTLYRVIHQWHHVHMATVKDEEFWPFTDPATPRWLRVLVAVGELTCGLFVGAAVYFRIFIRRGSPIRNQRVRRRIWMEYALSAVVWTVVLTAVAALGIWKYFLIVYFAPVFIAANLQSWRKYIEHVGMTGGTVNGCTRSVVAKGPFGRLMALTLLHEPFHGVHHIHATLRHPELPSRASALEPSAPGERPPFPSYAHALRDLLRALPDPRIGEQWHRQSAPERNGGSEELARSI